jgi:hypothetical protein
MNMREIMNVVEDASKSFHFDVSFNGKTIKSFDQNVPNPYSVLNLLASKLPHGRDFKVHVTSEMFDFTFDVKDGKYTKATQPEAPDPKDKDTYF